MELKGKVVVITGSSSGIGLACAQALAKEGANLVLGARHYVRLCEIARDLEQQYGIKAVAVATDVTDEASCKELIDQAILTFKSIDVLINNAGISMRALFRDVEIAVLKQVMDVNFWGTVYCSKYALPHLLASQGMLIGVSSIAGYVGLPGRSAYSASKFAMQGFLEVLRVENRKNKLKVLIACPGFTQSNIRHVALDADGKPQGESTLEEKKMMTSEEVAVRLIGAIRGERQTLVLTSEGKLTVMLSKLLPRFLQNQVYKRFAREKNSLLS